MIFIYKKLNPYLASYMYVKVKSKLIIDKNLKPKSIKFLEENICDFGFGKNFESIRPKA